jgi:hypothetical protein
MPAQAAAQVLSLHWVDERDDRLPPAWLDVITTVYFSTCIWGEASDVYIDRNMMVVTRLFAGIANSFDAENFQSHAPLAIFCIGCQTCCRLIDYVTARTVLNLTVNGARLSAKNGSVVVGSTAMDDDDDDEHGRGDHYGARMDDDESEVVVTST